MKILEVRKATKKVKTTSDRSKCQEGEIQHTTRVAKENQSSAIVQILKIIIQENP